MSYRFAARPRWVVMHVVVGAMVSLFAVAGFWQLWRLDQRREDNALVERRRALVPLTSLDAADVEHRRVRLEGRYDNDELVILTGRPLRGLVGNHVLVPLRVSGSEAVIVDRGWAPTEWRPPKLEGPRGDVSVEGVVLPSERKRPFASGTGDTDRIARIDLARLQRQIPYRIASVYILASGERPRTNDDRAPIPVEPAELGEGSHLTYAVQWFSFIAIALVVYAVLLRREARRRGAPPIAYDAGP